MFFEQAQSKSENILGMATGEDYNLLVAGDQDIDVAERGGDRSAMSIGYSSFILPELIIQIYFFQFQFPPP